jgi:hypothetical protein
MGRGRIRAIYVSATSLSQNTFDCSYHVRLALRKRCARKHAECGGCEEGADTHYYNSHRRDSVGRYLRRAQPYGTHVDHGGRLRLVLRKRCAGKHAAREELFL